MTIANIPIANVTEEHLLALLRDEVREGRHIDYKLEIYGGNDEARVEFLADVSSFANADGGDIVIGFEEKDGTPIAMPGLDASLTLENETLRLEQIARNGLQPRIGIAVRMVPLSSGRIVLVIRIPRSFDPAHRVIFKGRNRFWARSSAGKFEPDVSELRVLFSVVPRLAERIRDFRATRISQILVGETPVPLKPVPAYILIHIIPFVSVERPSSIDIARYIEKVSAWRPWGSSGWDDRVNFDGAVFYSGGAEGGRAYLQVFRTGAVESVATRISSDHSTLGKIVSLPYIITSLLGHITRITEGLRDLDITSPLAVSITMTGVKGATFICGDHFLCFDSPLPIPRDNLTFIDSIIPDGEKRMEMISIALKPLFDQMYQAGGAINCDLFDGDGKSKA